jgi:hypothetical protein
VPTLFPRKGEVMSCFQEDLLILGSLRFILG